MNSKLLKIRQFGEPSKVPPELPRLALRFYSERLMSKRLSSNILIRLFYKKGLLKDHLLEASCVWDDDHVAPREFTLSVDADLSKRKLLMSLAHEMVHVKQYATGQLKYYVRGPKCRWLGKPIDDECIPYPDLPWEKEAWTVEHDLYQDFIRIKR